MRHVVRHARVPLVGEHRVAGERLESDRGDEMRAGFGHHDMHFGALFDKQADEFGGFVGGDAPGDAENDTFTREFHVFDPMRVY